MTGQIPYTRIVIAASAAAIAGYLGFSIYVVTMLRDATMVGDIIGTWKSFAVLAFGFWLGSSSGGKARSDAPSGNPGDPVATTVEETR